MIWALCFKRPGTVFQAPRALPGGRAAPQGRLRALAVSQLQLQLVTRRGQPNSFGSLKSEEHIEYYKQHELLLSKFDVIGFTA